MRLIEMAAIRKDSGQPPTNLGHIEEIVATRQNSATHSLFTVMALRPDLIKEAFRMNGVYSDCTSFGTAFTLERQRQLSREP